MNLDAKTLRLILLIASILAMTQGLLTFIGGLVAAEDTSLTDIDKNNIIQTSKLWCGLIRFKSTGSCSFDAFDRGWFKRVHEGIRDGVSIRNKSPDMDELKKLVGYGAVISYALIVGLGWISSGGAGLLAIWWSKRLFALVAVAMYGVFYVLHIALFAAIWDSVRKVEDDCKDTFDRSCSDVKALAIRSSRELLGYAICGFITILCSAAGTFLYWYMVPEAGLNPTSTQPSPGLGQGQGQGQGQGAHIPTTGPLKELPPRRPDNAWDASLDKSKDASGIVITPEPRLELASQPPKA